MNFLKKCFGVVGGKVSREEGVRSKCLLGGGRGRVKCIIKIFRVAGVVTPSKPPPPYEQLLPLPTPYFKMFLERSLNDPPPPHFKHLSLLPPSPSTTPPPPPPLKILIIH